MASTESRRMAAALLEQYKSGDVNNSVGVAVSLCDPSRLVEAQHFGYSVLQHVSHIRWEELTPDQRATLSQISVRLLSQACAAALQAEGLRVVRSKCAQLVAQVVKQMTEPDMPVLRHVVEAAQQVRDPATRTLSFPSLRVSLLCLQVVAVHN
jgi:hypothetical protein